jgi:hypothetical protein
MGAISADIDTMTAKSTQAEINYRKPIRVRPRRLLDGDYAFRIPESMMEKDDEKALCLRFICNRRLFGAGYRALLPDYFDSMTLQSGVLIRGFVPTAKLFSEVSFPGDIDLLIIPFEADELVLSMTLAIELKAVRAKFKRQGKSPNQYGFSQASALLDCGLAYVAVAHLIVSDNTPRRVGAMFLSQRSPTLAVEHAQRLNRSREIKCLLN